MHAETWHCDRCGAEIISRDGAGRPEQLWNIKISCEHYGMSSMFHSSDLNAQWCRKCCHAVFQHFDDRPFKEKEAAPLVMMSVGDRLEAIIREITARTIELGEE